MWKIHNSIIHPNVKFQGNKLNNKIKIIGIQSRISHIHLPLFEDAKKESIEIGVNFHKKSCCVETFASKRDVEKSYEYNT